MLKKVSRKCFTIYVSVYNTHPLLELKSVMKSADYSRGKTVYASMSASISSKSGENITLVKHSRHIIFMVSVFESPLHT